VDIYDLEEPAIADTHISIIRLKADVNPLYVLYFMRSLLGRLQLERLEMAIKGTPEIYWYLLEQMRIIDLPRKKQDETVKEVQEELEELQRQKGEIKKLRNQIDDIFMEAITKDAKK
jgi:restriction endonuclease S subunit